MTETMTKADKESLSRLARARAKVAITQVDQVAAERLAEAEAQLSAEYKFSDKAWADVTAAAELAVSDADSELAKRCEEMGIPPEFRPKIGLVWRGNAIVARREELRRTARARVEADAKRAKAAVESGVVDVLTELVRDGLTSEAAHRFLSEMPSPAQLMPRVDMAAIEASA